MLPSAKKSVLRTPALMSAPSRATSPPEMRARWICSESFEPGEHEADALFEPGLTHGHQVGKAGVTEFGPLSESWLRPFDHGQFGVGEVEVAVAPVDRSAGVEMITDQPKDGDSDVFLALRRLPGFVMGRHPEVRAQHVHTRLPLLRPIVGQARHRVHAGEDDGRLVMTELDWPRPGSAWPRRQPRPVGRHQRPSRG